MVSRLNDIRGLDVFSEDGKHIGALQDITVDPETGKVLGVVLTKLVGDFAKRAGLEETGKGIVVPYMAVKSIGDIVLLKNIVYTKKHE
ncbi:MAG: PRC-barrel domain-containing protein [Candidatus Hydrothermarchaeales archaeon]